MRNNSTFNSVAYLRKILQKTQQDFAGMMGVSRNAIALIEIGKLDLSAKLADRISTVTGVSVLWLKAHNSALPITNFEERPYTASDFETAQKVNQEKDLKPLALYRDLPEQEVCVAYTILRRALKAARKRNQIQEFTKRIEHFIRSEISRYSELQKEVYRELRQWNERYVGTGRTYPKSFLFPRDEKSLEQGHQEFETAKEWFREWEKQIKSPQRPRNTRGKRYTASSSV
jgi:transcriptional regulator with XRE-family HTH domain